MDIYVNGNKLDFQLENEKKFGEVYNNLRAWAKKGNKKIWGLSIDDKSYNIDAPDNFIGVTLAEIKRVDVNVGDKVPAREFINKIEVQLNELHQFKKLMDSIVTDFHKGNENMVKEKWEKVISIMSGFNQTIPYYVALTKADTTADITKKLEEFKDILREIVTCIQLEDNVALCDQLEYELIPQVEYWEGFLTTTRQGLESEV